MRPGAAAVVIVSSREHDILLRSVNPHNSTSVRALQVVRQASHLNFGKWSKPAVKRRRRNGEIVARSCSPPQAAEGQEACSSGSSPSAARARLQSGLQFAAVRPGSRGYAYSVSPAARTPRNHGGPRPLKLLIRGFHTHCSVLTDPEHRYLQPFERDSYGFNE